MPRTVTITKEVYTFSELSDSAKESAREWFRKGNLDYEWWDSVYSDAAECGALLGLVINNKRGKKNSPAIYFSGFSSQGDGAYFEGYYSYRKGAAKAIREHAPIDTELHAIADTLQRLQRDRFYSVACSMSHRGFYSHSGCMSVDVEDTRTGDTPPTEEEFVQAMRDFADWIYRRLESEYEYLNSDECVDESIAANGCEFTESGKPA